MAAATKKKRKEEAYPWKASTSSGHITNLKQSILETLDIYAHQTQHSNPFCPIPFLSNGNLAPACLKSHQTVKSKCVNEPYNQI
jgi:hypothetical protein